MNNTKKNQTKAITKAQTFDKINGGIKLITSMAVFSLFCSTILILQKINK